MSTNRREYKRREGTENGRKGWREGEMWGAGAPGSNNQSWFPYSLITERFPLTTKTNDTGTHPLHLDHHVSTLTHAQEVASQGSQSIIICSNLLMKKNTISKTYAI